jgi:hypothetical protein
MKRKILEGMLGTLFFLTGCSVDSIANGGALEWVVSFLILVVVAWALFGGKE